MAASGGAVASKGLDSEMVELEDCSCPLCGSADADHLRSVLDYEYRTVTTFLGYWRCHQCGLIYLRPRPTAETQRWTYPREYEQYAEGMLTVSAKRYVQYLRRRLVIAPRMKRLLTLLPERIAPRILDVGCGNGHTLMAIKELTPASELHGVDLGLGQRELMATRGIAFHEGSFRDVTLREGYFDLVLLLHSIEHFPNPVDIMARVSKVLRPGGIAYLETHVSGSLEQRLFGAYWIGYDSPRHLTVFNEPSLRKLLASSDLCCLAYDDRVSSVGDMIYSLRRRGCDAPAEVVWRALVTDRNPILLAASLSLNSARLRFLPSSVAAVTAHKD